MAYGEKYILSFISERGNDYKISILQQGYSGSAVNKKLGVAPSLSIEEGDGRIKGSSLSFSIQADVEGELSGLYTINNKEFKVILYRNNSVYWQGYLLPELYSENYVDPPFDVAVTATDQLATLKGIAYNGIDVQTSLLEVIENILLQTQLSLSCNIHMNLIAAGQRSFLRETYISAAAFNGMNCYEALNAILLSCNACLMEIGNKWLITSMTDATTSYEINGTQSILPHCTIGQMYSADVWPEGSLNMINAPAIKGVTVEYSHILRDSFLRNAECSSKDGWNYTITDSMDLQYPMEFTAYSKVFKAYAWRLSQKNIKQDSALQLWQDVELKADAQTTYQVSVDYLMAPRAVMLLLAIEHIDSNGVARRLTADGWKTNTLSSEVANYIQITGEVGNNQLTAYDVANKERYETATVKFILPDAPGTLRIGFINTTTEGNAPVTNNDEIYVTRVYLTIDGITGKTATTQVEENATTAQEDVLLSYGDEAGGTNIDKIVLNTLKNSNNEILTTWYLSGRQFLSYYNAMLQEFSRWLGSKKMQLQGNVMGEDLLHPFYLDTFSGKVMRLVSGQYNLYDDNLSLTVEEVITSFVNFETVVYATDNKPQNTSGVPGASAVAGAGGGDSLLSVQSDGDVYVKNDRPLTGFEARFEQLALPKLLPAKPKAGERYVFFDDAATVEDELKAETINLKVVLEKLKRLEQMWKMDLVNDAIRTTYNVIIEKGLTFGTSLGKVTPGGGGTGITTFDILVNGQSYPLQDGKVQLPDYPIALKNPFALTINGTTYDGSEAVSIEVKGGVDDAQLADYAKKEWVAQQGYITESSLKDYATVSWVTDNYTTKEEFNPIKSIAERLDEVIGIDENGAVYIKKKTDGSVRNFYTYGAISFGGVGTSSNTFSILVNGNNYSLQNGVVELPDYPTELANPYALTINGTPYDGSEAVNIEITGGAADMSNYLSLDGGTMKGVIVTKGDDSVVIKPAKDNYDQIGASDCKFWKMHASSFVGDLEGTADAAKYATSAGSADYATNAGSADSANDAAALGGYQVERFLLMTGRDYTTMNLNTIGDTQSIFTEIRTSEVTTTNCPMTGYGALLSLKDRSGIAKMQFLGAHNSAQLYFRAQQGTNTNITSNWKTIAFTDSIVDSAKKLVYSSTVTGLTVNSSGDVVIQGTHLYSTSAHISDLGTSTTPFRSVYTRYIDTYSGYDLRFKTGNTEQMRISAASGCVILGGSSVADNSNYKLLISGNEYISGNIVITGGISFGTASDRRLKDNIKSMTDKQAVAVLSVLNPVTFEWNTLANSLDSQLKGVSDGFIADEYEKVIKNSGRDIWANYRAIDYQRATGYLVKGWQNHETRVQKLERRVKELENELKQYRRA